MTDLGERERLVRYAEHAKRQLQTFLAVEGLDHTDPASVAKHRRLSERLRHHETSLAWLNHRERDAFKDAAE